MFDKLNMAVPRLLMAVRRAAYLTHDYVQCYAAHSLPVLQCQTFRTYKKSAFGQIDDDSSTASSEPRRKTIPIPKITLLSTDDTVTVTDLGSAQRLAKRRNLILVKVNDPDSKTQRPLYKLVNNDNIIEEDDKETDKEDDKPKSKEKSKSTKLLYISTNIGKHDLSTKTRNVINLLNKGHRVKVVITLDSDKQDTTYSFIKETIKNHGNIQQMPSKKNTILLSIVPLLTKDNDSSINNKEGTDTLSISDIM